MVRANNIFQQPATSADGFDEAALVGLARVARAVGTRRRQRRTTNCGRSCSKPSRLDEMVEQVIATLEFSVLAEYAFSLAQSFNALLQPGAEPVVDPQRGTRGRAALARRPCVYVRSQLTRALDLMGIEVPARM